MSDLMTKDEIRSLIKENAMLKRRLERMAKEMKNFVALHDRAMKLRDFSEKEKNLQYEYNTLLLENAPDMIFILDPEMRFRLGTKTFVNFLGRKDAGTLIGSSFDEFFRGVMPHSWIESARAALSSAMDEQKQLHYNDEVSLSEGKKVFTTSVAPAIDSGGRIMGVICLMHDSTELVNMKEAAEAATQAKSSFLASMSHEIRTPLNAIKGFSDLMARTPLSAQQKVYADSIVNATSSLLMLISDILDFSKIEANRYEIVKVEYDTASELSELCDLMQPKAEEKGIYFAADIDPMLPAVLLGDNLRIRQVLVNIINNAIKFTHKGGVLFSVRGETLDDSDEWVITYSVKDTGQGIKQEALPIIFQSFAQVDFYKNRNISGTGLGLAISKVLAELMGGNIYVESEYDVGSEFTIRIPQTSASECAIAHVDNPKDKNLLLFYANPLLSGITEGSLEKLGVPYTSISHSEMLYKTLRAERTTHVIVDGDISLVERILELNPDVQIGYLRSVSDLITNVPDNVRILFKPLLVFSLAAFINRQDDSFARSRIDADKMGSMSFNDAKVLIVDDNEINQIVASEIVSTYDIEPDTASSGQEAIEKVKSRSYDIVFMDHMMPGMDGMEATKAIRAMDIHQPVIIALTANAILGMDEIYRSSGFDDYITKPIDVAKLNGLLEHWLGEKKLGGN